MIKLELEEQEVKAIIHLLDLAIKSQGIAVAEAAVFLIRKIESSIESSKLQNKESVEL